MQHFYDIMQKFITLNGSKLEEISYRSLGMEKFRKKDDRQKKVEK